MNAVDTPWVSTVALTSPSFLASLGEKKTTAAVRRLVIPSTSPLVASGTP